jgi:predicted SnoaL-like aldol condensation-catalyzing enzyme
VIVGGGEHLAIQAERDLQRVPARVLRRQGGVKRVFADCDFVITHSLFTGAVPAYGPLGSKGVDISRLDADGKVVEHWDVVAQISPTSTSGNPEV